MFLSGVPKQWQLAACSDTLFCLLCRRSMDQFIKLLPDGKSVTCLDDLPSLKLSELKKSLFSYNEKVSGNKANLVLRTYAVFSRATDGSAAALSRHTDFHL